MTQFKKKYNKKKKDFRWKNKTFIPTPLYVPVRRNSIFIGDGLLFIIIVIICSLIYLYINRQHYFDVGVVSAETFDSAVKEYIKAERFFLSRKANQFYWDVSNNADIENLHNICTCRQFRERFLMKCHLSDFRFLAEFFPSSLPSTQIWLNGMLVELKQELLTQAGNDFCLDPRDPMGVVWLKR